MLFNFRLIYEISNLTTAPLWHIIIFAIIKLQKRGRYDMKINQIIREKRRELLLTQEKIA